MLPTRLLRIRKMIVCCLLFLVRIKITSCQDISPSGLMPQNGNPFKNLMGNTGNSLGGMSAYNPRGNMASMTGYGPNYPPLQGMLISKAHSSSVRFGISPVQNSMNPIQPFMGMTPGCSCTLTVNMRGCFICPCEDTETPIPTTGVGTTSYIEAVRTGSSRSETTLRTYVSTTKAFNPKSTLSSAISDDVNEHAQLHSSADNKNNINDGQNLFLTSTRRSSPVSKLNTASDVKTHSGSADNVILKNSSDIASLTGNLTSSQHHTRNKNDVSSERSFPFAISLGCAFLLAFAVCCMLAHSWYNMRKQIKHQQNELYFVEKAFRQSMSSDDVSLNSADEIVYSLVGKMSPPVLPLRSPPLTPTAPPVSPATSDGSQTRFNLPPDEGRNDYLELI
ncbi:uncharacterized protein LOC110465072 isoform X2 [Mizuhopecten yessoensis]|uniref:uncharacterized protein LOC110465072 isoform X2 n=1 Tax=Mizuhopecten yessoensis TaxID=6573 RepID=UPI000B45C200|nr:uncharacterized protein LOC110465072 isoform X2 [Mizuhopecten yessoensis]